MVHTTELAEVRPSGRACHACRHPRVDELNQALTVDQLPIAHIARHFGLSRDSIYRHLRNHVRAALVAELDADPEARPVALVARVLTIANNARAASANAYRSGNAWLGARLADSELKALTVLAERHGIDHDATAADYVSAADNYRLAVKYLRAVEDLMDADPELSERIARALEGRGHPELAEQIRQNVSEKEGAPA